MDSVEVRLLGPLLVRRADGSVVGAEEWRSNKTLDLLRLLALNAGRPMSVATVVDRLWPSVDWDHGRASLRTAASQLRKVLGTDCLERQAGCLAVTGVWFDTWAYIRLGNEVEQARRAGDDETVVRLVREAEALYTGDVEVTTQVFNAGPAAIEALSAGAIDATYIGPNPSINTFIQSGGESARIVAGAATGGAALVVREGIDDSTDLAGTTIATPQLGNTQDVAARVWLADEGVETDTSGGGDVQITPTENAQTLTLFQDGQLDGAWLPEPWVSRLVIDAGAHVLQDEADLWEDGEFPTTVLLVRKEFLDEHPDVVADLLEGHEAAVRWIADNPEKAPAVINGAIEKETGKPLADAVIQRALEHVTFSVDPHADTFETLVENGVEAGTQKEGSIEGLFDLRLLNEQLEATGAEPVSAAGLGED